MPIMNLLTFDVMSEVKFSADIREEFGRFMQTARDQRGLSQKFVAQKIGITVTQLSRIENGKSGTERDTVIKWAQIVGVDENEALRHFKPENLNEDTYEIGFGIEVTFKNPNFSEDEKKNLLDSIGYLAAGVKTKKDKNTITLEEAIEDNDRKIGHKK